MIKEELSKRGGRRMTDSEERALNKVVELEKLCKSLSLSLKGRDDLLNATLKEKAELKRKLSKIQKMFEPQNFTDLMDEVEKEYADEQKINELEKENSRLNQIILGNEEEITDLRKDCEEYSKTFNRQNDEIISLRKELIELKNQIHKMRCCDNCCHCGGYTEEGGNSICDSCDDYMSEWEF